MNLRPMAGPAMQLVRPVHSCGSCVLSRSVSVVAMAERSLAGGAYAIISANHYPNVLGNSCNRMYL
jgi:hypothetical protein